MENNIEKIKISACVVVYKEERHIKDLLENISNFADEIILVYDGEKPEDKTIEIAENFAEKNKLNLKVFLRKHIGEAEPHRPFSFKMASNDWIIWIDADERILGDFNKVKDFLSDNPKVKRVRFLWGTENDLTRKNFNNRKAVLFNKNNNYFFGIPHEKPNLITGESFDYPKEIKLLHLETRRSFSSLLKRTMKWSKIHADSFFAPIDKIEKFNTNKQIEDKFERERKKKIKQSFFRIIPVSFLSFFNSIKKGKEIRNSIIIGLYSFLFYYFIIVNNFKNKIFRISKNNLI